MVSHFHSMSPALIYQHSPTHWSDLFFGLAHLSFFVACVVPIYTSIVMIRSCTVQFTKGEWFTFLLCIRITDLHTRQSSACCVRRFLLMPDLGRCSGVEDEKRSDSLDYSPKGSWARCERGDWVWKRWTSNWLKNTKLRTWCSHNATTYTSCLRPHQPMLSYQSLKYRKPSTVAISNGIVEKPGEHQQTQVTSSTQLLRYHLAYAWLRQSTSWCQCGT